MTRTPSVSAQRIAALSPDHTTYLRVLVAGDGYSRVAKMLGSSRDVIEELAEYGRTTIANRDRIAARLDEIRTSTPA